MVRARSILIFAALSCAALACSDITPDQDVSSASSTSALVVSSEESLSDTEWSARAFEQLLPAAASSTSNTLVVWETADQRKGRGILAVRYDTAGNPLDTHPIVLPAELGATAAGVATDGADYLVAWTTRRDSLISIRAARIDGATGDVLDPDGIEIVGFVPDSIREAGVDVAFDGTNYLVVWSGPSSTTREGISAARIDTNATVLDPSGFTISGDLTFARRPAVAANGNGFLVTWQFSTSSTSEDILAARIDSAGGLVDSVPIAIKATRDVDMRPDVASDGVDYFVVWMNTDSRDIMGTRVRSSNGAIDNPSGVELTGPGSHRNPSVAWGGTSFHLAWESGGSLMTRRFTPDGTLNPIISSVGSPADTAQDNNAVASHDGTHLHVFWHDERNGRDGDIYRNRVSDSLQVLDGTGELVSSYPNDQISPRIATNGEVYLVTWIEYADSGSEVLARRIDGTGAPLDVAPFKLGESNAPPSVTSNGTDFYVAWIDGDSAKGRRVVASDGSRPDSAPKTLGLGNRRVTVASDGRDYLAVFTGTLAPSSQTFLGRIVDSSTGDPVGLGPFAVRENAPLSGYRTEVTWNGTEYFVFWGHFDDRYGRRIDAAGNPLGTDLDFGRWDGWFDVFATDAEYLFVSASAGRLGGVRYTPDLTRIDRVSFEIASPEAARPSVAFDGIDYVVTWNDTGYRAPTTQRSRWGPAQLWGARVAGDGELGVGPPASGHLIAPLVDGYAGPGGEVACRGPRDCVVATVEYDQDLANSRRVKVRKLWTDDQDSDGVRDGDDNCPATPNPMQSDDDQDGVGDACDGCPGVANRVGGTLVVCVIDGVCFDQGDTNPANPCEVCEPALADDAWSSDEGEACDDGFRCTSNDRCLRSECVGERMDCSHLDEACVEGVCDEDTVTCVVRDVDEGTACAGVSCETDADCSEGKICELDLCVNPPDPDEDTTDGVTVDPNPADSGASEEGCTSAGSSPSHRGVVIALAFFAMLVFRRRVLSGDRR